MRLVSCLFGITLTAFAQFEVASIKSSLEMGRGISIHVAPGGRFDTTNATLKDLIAFAYDVRPHQIVDGPSWAESAGFDIVAKGEDERQIRGMVQKLLADRFGLTLHAATREMPVYALVVGKGGPKFYASEKENMSISGGGKGRVMYQKATMALFAQNLAPPLGRTVVDRTGLAGEYDFTLGWSPEEGMSTESPSLFTALQEQLGLKLESAKAPVKILVVDHAEKPSQN